MVYAAGSVVWEVDRWSLAGQTAAYFLVTLGSVGASGGVCGILDGAQRRGCAWLRRNLLCDLRRNLIAQYLDGAQK